MAKLQLYFNISRDGFKKKFDINPDPAIAAQVTDVSDAVENISYIPQEKHIFYILKYVEEGVFVIIIRTIPDKVPDHVAAWVFVPRGMEIRTNDLSGITEGICGHISNHKMTSEDLGRLRQLFAREYPVTDPETSIIPNFGNQYAHRYFGSDTGLRITDFIGPMRYQTANLPFAGVILADKDDVTGIDGTNLSAVPLRPAVRLLPPPLCDNGFTPSLFNIPFTSPTLISTGAEVEILWDGPDGESLVQEVTVETDNMRPANITAPVEPYPVQNENVEPADDPVQAEETPEPREEDPEPLEVVQHKEETVLAEKDRSTEDTQPAETRESEATPESSESPEPVEAPEAKPEPAEEPRQEQTFKSASVNENRQKTYRFELPASDASIGGMIEFEIKTSTEIKKSPVEGYELTDIVLEGPTRINHLIYNPATTTANRLRWGIGGAIVGFLLAIVVNWMFSGSKTADVTALQPENPAAIQNESGTPATTTPETQPTATSAGSASNIMQYLTQQDSQSQGVSVTTNADAITYLDNNSTWKKEEMEEFPLLQGLYDDMNNLNLDKLSGEWAEKLNASSRFASVANHARMSLSSRKLQRRNIRAPYNTNTSDTRISVQNYLNRIDP